MSDNGAGHEWANESVDLPDGFWEELPKPMYWRILVMPVNAVEQTKGGIVIPVSAQENQSYLNYIGKVVALGPTAGKHQRLGGDGDNPAPGFPKVGEFVTYGRYAGQRLTYRNKKFLILNDDEILTSVPNPDTLTVHL